HHLDATPPGNLTDAALEALLGVVDDVIGAEGTRLRRFLVAADRGDHGRSGRLGELDRGRADATATCVHENRLALPQPGVIEQHMLRGPERDRRHRGSYHVDAMRCPDGEPRRDVHQLAAESINVKAVDIVLRRAEVVAAVAAGGADATGMRAVKRHDIARPQLLDSRPDGCNLTGSFVTRDEWQSPPGESHAAPAPDIDMIEGHGANADLHLPRA